MKRKLGILALIVIMCASLIGCAQKKQKPDGMSEEMYDLGTKTVELMDKYLDDKIDYDKALEEITELSDQSEAVDTNKAKDLETKVYIDALKYCIDLLDPKADDTVSELQKGRDELAAVLELD